MRSPNLLAKTTCLIVLLLFFCMDTASAADLNNDGQFDCLDLDLLGTAIYDQSHDPAFDLDNNGFVDFGDVRFALSAADIELGDANLDGRVDRLDANIVGLNWLRETTSYCQGDFNLDGIVNSADRGEVG